MTSPRSPPSRSFPPATAGGGAGAGGGAPAAPVELVSSSDGRGWRGVRALRFRHTSGEVEVPPFSAHAVIVHLGPPVDVGESVDGGQPREARAMARGGAGS